MRARALLLLLLSSALGSTTAGCAHDVTVRSEPAGADVYLLDDDGEGATLLGPAPVTVSVENGVLGGGATIVVADERTAVQVGITRGRITPSSFGSSALDTAGTLLCCGSVAAGAGALTFWLWPLLPWLAWPAACVTGCAGVTTLLQPLACACGMWAPPDIVNVNLRSATASSQPGEMVDEVQRVDGPPALVPSPDDEDDDRLPGRAPDEVKPPLSEGGAIEILHRPPMRY